MDQFEFYKELYHKENERKAEIINALNIPIAVTTAISTGTYFFITNFDYEVEGFLNFVFVGLITITIACVLISIYNLIRAFSDFTKGYEYTGIPYVQQLHDWYEDLIEYYQDHGDKEENSNEADEQLTIHLINSFVEHIDHNMYVNDRKTKFIFHSKRMLVMALVSILTSSIPFGYNFFRKADKVQKMIILNEQENEVNQLLNETSDSTLFSSKEIKLQYEPQEDTLSSTSTSTKDN